MQGPCGQAKIVLPDQRPTMTGTSPNVSHVLMPDVRSVSQAPGSRGEPHRARRATRGYLAAAPFFVAGASFLPAISGALAFKTPSANVRWLASSCSAKS
jgi:hypothetical protein